MRRQWKADASMRESTTSTAPTTRKSLGFAPWLAAGALLLAAGSPVTAQEATPPPDTGLEVVAQEDADDAAATQDVVEDTGATETTGEATGDDDREGRNRENREGRGGGSELAAVPATGVGAGALGGIDPLAIGATVSAAAAAVVALRGRFTSR